MKEDQRTEFKRNWRDEFLKELCAFANSQGGTLYIGVEDDGTVIGISDAKALLENMPNKVLSNLGILANVELMASDGKEYVSVRVEGQDNPVSYGGKFFVRTGSTTQELRGRELARFLQKKMDIEWDALTQCDATMDDIDEKAVKYFVEKAIEDKRIDESVRYEDKGTVLEKLGLIAANGELTNAALLLFGKDVERWYPTAIFRIGRFGASQADLIMHDNIACALIEMPKNVIGMLRNKYLIARNGYEGLSRREPLEIPEDGLREMLCNAIIHKDYTSTYIQMRVWDKEVELWNPGPLPEELTVASLMEKHASMPRNPKIAKVFFLAGFIESWGRGYERIRESFDKAHLAMPKFEQVHGGFMATIQREVFMRVQGGNGETESDVIENVTENVIEKRGVKMAQLTKRQLVIIKRLVETGQRYAPGVVIENVPESVLENVPENDIVNNTETLESLATLCGKSTRTIHRDITGLKELGLVRRDGGDLGGIWVVLTSEGGK